MLAFLGSIFLYSSLLNPFMKLISLTPSQVIGMVDYPPLHSPRALSEYYDVLSSGGSVEGLPVAPVHLVKTFFEQHPGQYNAFKKKLESFLRSHKATHFMFGGKHRAFAAMLANRPIACFEVNSDADVAEALLLRKKGKLKKDLGLGKSLEESLAILLAHFYQHKMFWTMEEKTKLMIARGDVPKRMLGSN